jgi:hypothetical protein
VARADVGHHTEVRPPGSGLAGIGDEDGGSTERVGQDADQPVQDPLAADDFQTLRTAAEPGGAAAGQDRAVGRQDGQ